MCSAAGSTDFLPRVETNPKQTAGHAKCVTLCRGIYFLFRAQHDELTRVDHGIHPIRAPYNTISVGVQLVSIY